MIERAEEIYLRVVELAPEDRSHAVARECGDDTKLREHVQRLLSLVDDESLAFLSEPLVRSPDTGIPEHIGDYRITRVIGEGTSGTVFEGEQPHPKRRVAVKVLRGVCSNARDVAAFRFEAEILGRLQHARIAKVFESGVFRGPIASQPFIAMEFVDGTPLDQYVRELGELQPTDAIEMIIKVCDAAEHAHRHGVVHRDLKPANVLVTNDDDIKLVDFGIARLNDRTAFSTTMPTFAGLCGTLPYMSPELVEGDADSVDARTDVYSLGVMLFELLTGRQPIDLEDLSLSESLRSIANQPAPPLRSLVPELRGDLETIIACAMAKEPDERYSSAQAFREDLESYLAHMPITARPPSLLYVTGKFVRRHRALVALGALAIFSLIAGTIGTSIYAWQSAQRAEESERRLALARDSLDLLFAEVIEALPRYAGTGDLLERVLEQGTGYYSKLADEVPDSVAERRRTGRALESLAETRLRLGKAPAAYSAATRFHELIAADGFDESDDAHSFDRLRAEWLLHRLGEPGHERSIAALASRLERTQANNPDVLAFLGLMLVSSQEGSHSDDFKHAERLCQAGLAIAPEHDGLLDLRSSLDDHKVNYRVSLGEFEVAREIQTELVARTERRLHARATDPTMLNNLCVSRTKLSNIAAATGDLPGAIAMAERALRDARELVSLEPRSVVVRHTLASTLQQLGTVLRPEHPARAFQLFAECCRVSLTYRGSRYTQRLAVRCFRLASLCVNSIAQGRQVHELRDRLLEAIRDGSIPAQVVLFVAEHPDPLFGARPASDPLADLVALVADTADDVEVAERASRLAAPASFYGGR